MIMLIKQMFIDGKYTLYLPHKFGGREKTGSEK